METWIPGRGTGTLPVGNPLIAGLIIGSIESDLIEAFRTWKCSDADYAYKENPLSEFGQVFKCGRKKKSPPARGDEALRAVRKALPYVSEGAQRSETQAFLRLMTFVFLVNRLTLNAGLTEDAGWSIRTRPPDRNMNLSSGKYDWVSSQRGLRRFAFLRVGPPVPHIVGRGVCSIQAVHTPATDKSSNCSSYSSSGVRA